MKTLAERIEAAALDMGFDGPDASDNMLEFLKYHGLTIVIEEDLQKIRAKVTQLQVLLAPKDEE